MRISDLLQESPQSIGFAMTLARKLMADFWRLLPSSKGFLELPLSKYVQDVKYISDTTVRINRGVGDVGGMYDHPKSRIVINNGYDGESLHGYLEQVLVHELAHTVDGNITNMRVFKPNKIAYPHKPTEVNARFNELIFLLDRKFKGKRVDFETYVKVAMTMLAEVELNPTSMDNIELHVPKHLRHLPVEATFAHLKPMLGIQHKTYKRILNRLYTNWNFYHNNG